MQSNTLADILLAEWRAIRALTYAYLDELAPHHLALRLPFPESQTLGYQFRCMTGAHESYLRKLQTGSWQGFASSLDQFATVTPAIIQQQMRTADDELATFLATHELSAPLASGQPGHEVLLQMIKHEMHHHGQLINFLYCHQLPIPSAWADEWALSRD